MGMFPREAVCLYKIYGPCPAHFYGSLSHAHFRAHRGYSVDRVDDLMPAPKPVTVITGASAGIGEALAGVFAAHGHTTALVARRLERLEAVAKRIISGGGAAPLIFAIDLERPTGADVLARALAQAGVEPAIIVNNAGFGLRGAAASLDRARQLAMIDVNVRVLT